MAGERFLLAAGHLLVAGVDEVGRGALAGPVGVGVVTVTAATAEPPAGLADSKLLTPAERSALAPVLRVWARGWAVGFASAPEVDRVGLTGALRLAGHRALDALPDQPDAIILDGKHDWLTAPVDLFQERDPDPWLVTLAVKADRTHASVAAASVLAKVARDALMEELGAAHPAYGWGSNKGYGTAAHLQALAALGPTAQHRQSWSLPPRIEPQK
ncbi:MAG: ribonuclease HII [Bifidobacteriaceae bacterium]|nr:ribonuclease HII [Bifidobacteriaceae bacterium]